jgi:hypothetical protein
MTLLGASELRARLNAIQDAPRQIAHDWADEEVRRTKALIPVRTGTTAGSIRADSVSETGARVVGSPVVNFLASGTKAHSEEAKGQAMRFAIQNRTIFSKKVFHPATRGNPAIRQAGREALGRFADVVIGLWNRAA